MTESEVRTEQDRELAILLALFITGIGLMYIGRAVFLYHGGWLTGGFGGIAVMLGGGDQEAAQAMMDAAARREPTFREQLSFYAGAVAILLNVIGIRGGIFNGR